MTPEEQELVAAVRDLARKKFVERAAGYDRERRFPRENVDELVALGVHALILPKATGGLGMGPEAMVRVMEEIAWADASTAVALNMHLLIAHFLRFLPAFPHGANVLEDMAPHRRADLRPGLGPDRRPRQPQERLPRARRRRPLARRRQGGLRLDE